MKIGFIGITQLKRWGFKRKRVSEREKLKRKTVMFYKPFHLPDKQPRISCNVHGIVPLPFFPRNLPRRSLLPQARLSRLQSHSALRAALGSLCMLEFNRLCPCAHSTD